MSTFVLINSVRVGTNQYFAGQTLNDAVHPTVDVIAAGGTLVATGNSTIDAAAAKTISARTNRGADVAFCDATMFAAMAAVQTSNATQLAAGLMSSADKTTLDNSHAAAGADLTDAASQTIQITAGAWRKLPTLSQNGVLTLGTTGAAAGMQLEVTRTSTAAFTYTVNNGGAGAGTLVVMPASTASSAKFQFDGTDWSLRSVGSVDT